jgi:hypothetical protein
VLNKQEQRIDYSFIEPSGMAGKTFVVPRSKRHMSIKTYLYRWVTLSRLSVAKELEEPVDLET